MTPAPWAAPLHLMVTTCRTNWGVRPLVTLACAGYADEHWQVRHPDDEFPAWTVDANGVVEQHPDAGRA